MFGLALVTDEFAQPALERHNRLAVGAVIRKARKQQPKMSVKVLNRVGCDQSVQIVDETLQRWPGHLDGDPIYRHMDRNGAGSIHYCPATLTSTTGAVITGTLRTGGTLPASSPTATRTCLSVGQ